VGISDYGLLHYRDAQGHSAGLDVDLVRALEARSGCQLPIQVESRARIADGLTRGWLGLSPSTLYGPERAAVGELWPYARSPVVVLVPRTVAAQVPTRDAFTERSTLKLVVVRGHRHGPELDTWVQALRAQGRVTEAGDVPTAVRLLRAGRAHGLISVAVAVSPGMDDLAPMPWDPGEALVGHLWVGHHLPAADRQQLRQSLDALLADGTVDRIFRQHLGEALAQRTRVGGRRGS
jgi:polar amino acid transport system substrate-binding protein